MPSLFIEEPSGCSIVPLEPDLPRYCRRYLARHFHGHQGLLARISGGVCLAVISLRSAIGASAAPLARLRVAVKNSVASLSFS